MSRSSSNRSSSGATPTTSLPRPDIDPKLTAISVEKIAKSFKGVPVIDDIDLEIQAGELIGLLGPSGSGKTTLLRIIAGLETPDSGRIVFGGQDTTRIPVQKREVGFVFQHYALFKHMTVADNIAYGLNARRRNERPAKDVVKKRVGDLLDLIKLSNFADRYPSQLSGGQRQRVALARALAVEPRVLLLDEPFGALDAQVRKDLRRWLRDIHQRTGQTTIFVTHDQSEALELSDRVAVLHGGRLEQVGTPTEIQDRPASVAVLKFLGDAMEIPAEVVNGTLRVGGRPVPVDVARQGHKHSKLFVRPWHFELSSSEQANLVGTVRNAFKAEGRTQLTVTTDGGMLAVALPQNTAYAVDTDIHLKITDGYLFEASEN